MGGNKAGSPQVLTPKLSVKTLGPQQLQVTGLQTKPKIHQEIGEIQNRKHTQSGPHALLQPPNPSAHPLMATTDCTPFCKPTYHIIVYGVSGERSRILSEPVKLSLTTLKFVCLLIILCICQSTMNNAIFKPREPHAHPFCNCDSSYCGKCMEAQRQKAIPDFVSWQRNLPFPQALQLRSQNHSGENQI